MPTLVNSSPAKRVHAARRTSTRPLPTHNSHARVGAMTIHHPDWMDRHPGGSRQDTHGSLGPVRGWAVGGWLITHLTEHVTKCNICTTSRKKTKKKKEKEEKRKKEKSKKGCHQVGFFWPFSPKRRRVPRGRLLPSQPSSPSQETKKKGKTPPPKKGCQGRFLLAPKSKEKKGTPR